MTLCRCSAIRVLLQRILDHNLTVSQKLTVHQFNSRVGSLKVVVADKGKALWLIGFVVSCNLWMTNKCPKRAEGIIQ